MALSTLAFGCESAENEQLVTLQDFSVEAPDHWDVIYYASNEAQFKTPDPSFMDYLIMDVQEVSDFEAAEASIAATNEATEVVVYDDACGGALDCFTLQVGESHYSVTFTVESTETPPADLDGVWAPQVEVSTQELIDLLMTAEPSQG